MLGRQAYSYPCVIFNIFIKLVKDIRECVWLSHGAQSSKYLGCGLSAPKLQYEMPASFWIIELVCSSKWVVKEKAAKKDILISVTA